MYGAFVWARRVLEHQKYRFPARAGVKALCITVDSAVAGKRERDLRNKIAMALGREAQQTAAAGNTKARKAGSYGARTTTDPLHPSIEH